MVEHDSSNTKRLNITIMDMPRFAPGDAAPVPVFLLRCIFDDHVRCMTACQVRRLGGGAWVGAHAWRAPRDRQC